MKKTKITLEYPLKNASMHILWNSVSTPLGLTEWFANGVTVKGKEYTFIWEQLEQLSMLVQLKQNHSVRFQWEEDFGTDYYFEFRIEMMEITGELALVVTDFTEPHDVKDLTLLWNQQIEKLRRKTGM